MAPIINDIGRKVSSAGKKSRKAVADYFRIRKLKTQISQEKGKIAAFYTEVGQACYEQYSGDRDDQFAEIFSRIRFCEDWIEELEREIQKIRNIKICPRCGLTVEYWTLFCPKCGVAFPESPDETKAGPPEAGQPGAEALLAMPDAPPDAPDTGPQEIAQAAVAESAVAQAAVAESAMAQASAQDAEVLQTESTKKRGRKPKGQGQKQDSPEAGAQAAASQGTDDMPVPGAEDGAGDADAPAEEARVCPNCGTALEAGGIFCSECRTRVG